MSRLDRDSLTKEQRDELDRAYWLAYDQVWRDGGTDYEADSAGFAEECEAHRRMIR